VRVQLKLNWTQEPKLDVNYEPHKRLILLLDGHKFSGQAIYANVAEHAYKSTNEGKPLVLGAVIRVLRETEARNRERTAATTLARARNVESGRKDTAESDEMAQGKQAKAERRVTFVDGDVAPAGICRDACGASSQKVTLDCGTQTPTVGATVHVDRIAGLARGHWLHKLCSWRCPACADPMILFDPNFYFALITKNVYKFQLYFNRHKI
jgi:hypothetical protein